MFGLIFKFGRVKQEKLQYKKYTNWKEYFNEKFSDTKNFSIEQFDINDENLENYRVTSNDENCDTEIIIRLFKNKKSYLEIFDAYFNNPVSPKLTEDNKSNEFGFDGQGSTFNETNFIDLDDWLNIPIYKGWIERTTFYEDREIKTDCIWNQEDKTEVIPIKQNYLDNIGCLLFFLKPFKIRMMNRKLKLNPDKVRFIENKISPMIV
jgi:hypothetical protein